MKKIISLLLVASFVVASAFSSLAATANVISNSAYRRQVEPAKLTLADINTGLFGKNGMFVAQDKRAQLSATHQQPAKMINAKRINNTTIAIRLQFGDDAKNPVCEDFMVTTKSYTADNTNPADPKYYIGNDIVYTRDQMINLYGPACFYFGVFEDTGDHKICGFGLATRCKRWPSWFDLSFGSGSYDQESSSTFYEDHVNNF